MHSLLELPIVEEQGRFWRYSGNDQYRFILEAFNEKPPEGQFIFGNPLVCIGANSSTAVPGSLDPTLKTVDRIAKKFGYDGFIMLNLSPIRATKPKDLPPEEEEWMYKENIEWIEGILQTYSNVYCAWGKLIEMRPYMNIFKDLQIPEYVNWLCRGKISKAGHPHHPLYVRDDEPLLPFPLREYAEKMKGM